MEAKAAEKERRQQEDPTLFKEEEETNAKRIVSMERLTGKSMDEAPTAASTDAPGRLQMITQLSPKYGKGTSTDDTSNPAAVVERVWQKAEIAAAADRTRIATGREEARERFFAKSRELAATLSDASSTKTPVKVERVAGKHIVTGMGATAGDLSAHTAVKVSTSLIGALVEGSKERVSQRNFRPSIENLAEMKAKWVAEKRRPDSDGD